ncbi:MAG: tRNA lysidine(34) synthetase TilS [Granulosicoccus sp.]|nr:tRNA lysidine(34) synthetase TilS [Granulosicoccus sp.]
MTPLEAVSQYVAKHLRSPEFCVAYSAGVDSHVLLLLMSDLARRDRSIKLRAVHVDHGLQQDSGKWAEHARTVCEQLSVPLDIRKCESIDGKRGPEANARRARYRQFADVLKPGEHMLLGQHAEDQAETFLLQALRGSGPDGLSAIPRKRRFGGGFMGRPLLYCSKDSILELARKRHLQWIDDPSNQEERFDRNFLRHQVIPLLKSRWPGTIQTLGRSAQRCAVVSQSMTGFARQDLASVTLEGEPELSISALAALPRERAFAALRLWIRQRNLPMPRLQDLQQVHANLLMARPDSHGVVNMREYEFRRYRDSLYLRLPQDAVQPYRHEWRAPFSSLFISETGLTLTHDQCKAQRIRLPEKGTVIVKSRAGGELIRVGEPAFHKQVKQILQEAAIPPWKRDAVPLLYADGQLIAVWKHAVAADFCLPAEGSEPTVKPGQSSIEALEAEDDRSKDPVSENA